MKAHAKELAKIINETNSTATLSLIWKKSRTWGACPSVYWAGYKVAHASGCGYDKRSAALAMALDPLGFGALRFAGCGLRSLQESAALAGYELIQTYQGLNEEGYTLRRI